MVTISLQDLLAMAQRGGMVLDRGGVVLDRGGVVLDRGDVVLDGEDVVEDCGDFEVSKDWKEDGWSGMKGSWKGGLREGWKGGLREGWKGGLREGWKGGLREGLRRRMQGMLKRFSVGFGEFSVPLGSTHHSNRYYTIPPFSFTPFSFFTIFFLHFFSIFFSFLSTSFLPFNSTFYVLDVIAEVSTVACPHHHVLIPSNSHSLKWPFLNQTIQFIFFTSVIHRCFHDTSSLLFDCFQFTFKLMAILQSILSQKYSNHNSCILC